MHPPNNTPNPEHLPEASRPAKGYPIPEALKECYQSPRIQLALRQAFITACTPERQQQELARCKADMVYWFNRYAVTFDPRLGFDEGGGLLPFKLYPFQVEVLHTLQQHLQQGKDILIEKSRDMGLSWLLALAFQWYWQFHTGGHFLIGSRKFDSVDQRGDMSSLFEKIRFNLQHQPVWLLPAGFNPSKHSTSGKLFNPQNHNTIVGEASTDNFARGGRYKAILLDEFAFWPMADASYASAGQATPCRIVVSTPYGMNNRFADLRFSGLITVVSLHWSLHPHKTQAWYEAQCQRMTPDEIARELDINYRLSIRNRVFNEFAPKHKASNLQLNAHRRVVRVWDFGYHCPACLLMQEDERGRWLVLREYVGQRVALVPFAQQVLRDMEQRYGLDLMVSDYCDPAGGQVNDKGEHTSIDLLNQLGIYPQGVRCPLVGSIEKVRHALLEERPPLNGQGDSSPALLIDSEGCPQLVLAFEGGYRYPPNAHDSELPLEEHPYEDVMDCLRYGLWATATLQIDEATQQRWLQRKRWHQRNSWNRIHRFR